MAATMATSMAILNANCFKNTNPSKPTKPLPLLSLQNLPKGLTTTTAAPHPITSTAVAGAVFSALSAANPAFAAQQLAEIAEGDNRGLALLIPLIPAVLWVLYNILQPALNQINRMRSSKGVIIGLGLGGLAAAGFLHTPEASAGEVAALAEAAADNRGQLLLFVVAPAIAWVLYNILQPALNQINRMRSD
ncbi:photosystem II BY [Perilla frutescens var. hirtella]|uniref:Photosystem II BY n=1 Tax=Perilla frutescens var. hirtella TaxID=608512 RepID=A0AAD4P0E8_PERFH|nr:photosystem II BY [Perilla frutescens var. hirtella]KAH6805158.1 photosystem II BY [Perilla frutescens var. frutescens]KAH6821472.1 photosystem II BY [Perilla frutescens var. hirtella]